MRDDLIEQLKGIVQRYLSETDASELLPYVKGDTVKYVLVELERRRLKTVDEADGEVIKDLYFHFC